MAESALPPLSSSQCFAGLTLIFDVFTTSIVGRNFISAVAVTETASMSPSKAAGVDAVRKVPQPSSDPLDPLNWSLRSKVLMLVALTWTAFIMTGAPTTNQLGFVVQSLNYDKSPVELSYTASAAIAGFIGGPFFYPPLFAAFGRPAVLFWGILAQLCTQIWAARMTSRDDYIPLVISRLLSGCLSVLPKTTSFFANRVQTFVTGWRHVAPWRARTVWEHTKAPFIIISIMPVAIIPGLYNMVAFGFSVLVQLLLSIFLQTPEQAGGYGFTPLRNAYFSFVTWAALLAAEIVGLLLNDFLPLAVTRRANGKWAPEHRLWPIIVPAATMPIGLGIYGAALQYHLHYMVLALGHFLV